MDMPLLLLLLPIGANSVISSNIASTAFTRYLCYENAFLENVFRDLDLLTHDLEILISSWA